MKKFWISFIALLMGVVIGVGIWHGIAFKDKLTSFVKDTWSKIESVFVNKDNVSSEGQKPSEDQPTPDKPSEEQFSLDGLYYLVVDGDTTFVQIKDSKYGTIHGYIQDSKIYLANDWESEIELEPLHITEDEKYLHVFWIDQENGQEDKIAIYDKVTKKLYYDFSNGEQFPGETYEDQLLSEMIKFENFELHEHSFDEIVYSCPPSCNAAGREIRKCLCKKTEMIETSPALGHDYVNGKCTRCGEEVALTWLINEKPDYQGEEMLRVIIPVMAGGNSYNGIQIESTVKYPAPACIIIFTNGPEMYKGNGFWPEFADRTVTFGTAPSGELLTWLQANATPQA